MPLFLNSVTEVFGQRLDLLIEPMKISLVASDYVPDYVGHKFVVDVAGSFRGPAVDVLNRFWKDTGLGCDDVTFPGLTGDEINGQITWIDRGTPETSLLVGYGRLMETSSPSGDFLLRLSPFGVINWKNQPVFY